MVGEFSEIAAFYLEMIGIERTDLLFGLGDLCLEIFESVVLDSRCLIFKIGRKASRIQRLLFPWNWRSIFSF